MATLINETMKIVPRLIKFPSRNTNIDFDKEADVLYITFDRTNPATDSEMVDNVLVRKNKDKIIGLTIMNVSQINS